MFWLVWLSCLWIIPHICFNSNAVVMRWKSIAIYFCSLVIWCRHHSLYVPIVFKKSESTGWTLLLLALNDICKVIIFQICLLLVLKRYFVIYCIFLQIWRWSDDMLFFFYLTHVWISIYLNTWAEHAVVRELIHAEALLHNLGFCSSLLWFIQKNYVVW